MPELQPSNDDTEEWLFRLRQAYARGDRTEFPNGVEPEEERLFVHAARPNALPGSFTQAEWLKMFALRDQYDRRMDSLGGQPFDDESLVGAARDFAAYLADADAEHWEEAVLELADRFRSGYQDGTLWDGQHIYGTDFKN